MQPPVAKKVPVTRSLHGDDFVDDYAWIRDRDDPDTLVLLKAENEFTEACTRHLEGLREAIFGEIKSRTQEDDITPPARRGDWWYAARTEEGKQYPRYVRMKGAPDGDEQVLLDVNELAEGHDYLRVGVFSVSHDQRYIAYSTDTDGSEKYTLRIKDLETGQLLGDVLDNTYYSAAWSADGQFLFYTTLDDAHRPDKVWRHRVGGVQADDVLAYHETDERMFIGLSTSQDKKYLFIGAGSQITADARYLPADDPTAAWRPVVERIHGVEYDVDHKDGRWIVATNYQAVNGKLLSIAVDDPSDVETLIEHDPARKVAGVLALAGHLVIEGRADGLTSLTVIPDGGSPRDMTFDDAVYSVGISTNYEYETSVLRIGFTSLTTPPSIFDIDLETDERDLVKETPVLGDFDPGRYVASREWATADDGTRIPISLVRPADADASSPGPLLLYGYGSYESCIDPWFSIARLSLLDRGVSFAIAHVRGGGEMGKPWYEAGKLERKPTTFTDFVACAEHLVARRITAPDRMAARGGSAGGLLMGAVANLRPDLFAAIVAEVPFVDVVNTMLDETLPLTIIEWEEWGNPKDPDAYRWIRSYSPYDNVEAKDYPAMLVTAGLNDPRVAYWEPAKWVSRLRALATTRGPLLLKTELDSGHGGPSGRYEAWKDEAFVLAFVLDRITSGD